jgi:hypothetical protein
MQGWIVFGAWLFAVIFAAVILGFAGYEVSWKLRRLQSDQTRLGHLIQELAGTATQLQVAGTRAGTLRSPATSAGASTPHASHDQG